MQGYDEKCGDLARHFLTSQDSDERIAELAQVIQDAVEYWFAEEGK